MVIIPQKNTMTPKLIFLIFKANFLIIYPFSSANYVSNMLEKAALLAEMCGLLSASLMGLLSIRVNVYC